MTLLGLYNYWVYSFILVVGLYAVLVRGNLVKRMMGLGIFQGAVFLLFISMDKIEGGTGPIFVKPPQPGDLFSNPLPQVLILTAIVVGIAVTALGLAISIRVKEEYGTIEEAEIREMDRQE